MNVAEHSRWQDGTAARTASGSKNRLRRPADTFGKDPGSLHFSDYWRSRRPEATGTRRMRSDAEKLDYIRTGKPVGKAVLSGVGGALAAAGTGAAIGTMFGGPVGTVAGAGVGIVFGMATSGALDAAYDRLPAGTQKAIEDGFRTIGDGVGDAAEAVGNTGEAAADNAKKVWNSIF